MFRKTFYCLPLLIFLLANTQTRYTIPAFPGLRGFRAFPPGAVVTVSTTYSYSKYGWPIQALTVKRATTTRAGIGVKVSRDVEWRVGPAVVNTLVILCGALIAFTAWRTKRENALAARQWTLRTLFRLVTTLAMLIPIAGMPFRKPWLGGQAPWTATEVLSRTLITFAVGVTVWWLLMWFERLISSRVSRRYVLRTLAVAALLVPILFGVLAWQRERLIQAWREEQPVRKAILNAGGRPYATRIRCLVPQRFIDAQYLSRVTRVDLRHARNTDEILQELKPLTRLERLYLKDSDVTDAGIAIIAQMDALTGLELARTGITDNGVRALSGHPGLQNLNLSETEITDACLESLKSIPRLRTINVWSTDASNVDNWFKRSDRE